MPTSLTVCPPVPGIGFSLGTSSSSYYSIFDASFLSSYLLGDLCSSYFFYLDTDFLTSFLISKLR